MRRVLLAVALGLSLVASGCTNPLAPPGDGTTPGARAGDYLRATPYTSILVELDLVTGAEPEGSALSLFQQRLQTETGKSVEIVRTPGLPGQGSGHRYTASELQQLETSHRAQFSQGNRAVIYIMYLDGGFERDTDDQKVLGAAYRGSALAMFKGNMRAYSKQSALDLQKPDIAQLEQSVLVHELGHLLGLVNIGAPMQTNHEDPEHPGHSTNRNSVMYWEVEQVSLVGTVLGQAPPDDFDSNDKADLQAMRRGGAEANQQA
ncbi:MAG TPA: hypothetical protein VGR28_12615 [Candidatus Thermoplasmatota archaeon]|nr:hypothetical protein [Candidatus Thermoplasmatota archaeon]